MRSQRLVIQGAAFALMAALALSAHAITLEELTAGLESGDRDARVNAAMNAGPVGAAAVVPLGERMGNPDYAIASAARIALEKVTHHAGRAGADAERSAVAQELAKLLDAAYPEQTRREALYLLSLVAGPEQAPAIAGLLGDAALRDDARVALDRMPCDEALQALIAALAQAEPEFRVLLIDSLGHRKTEAAVPALMAEARGPDKQAAWAAFEALTDMGVFPNAVFPRSPQFTPEELDAYGAGFIRAAHALLGKGDTQAAESMYAYAATLPANKDQARVALNGLAAVGSERLIEHALGYLAEPGVRDTAAMLLRQSALPEVDDRLARAYPMVAAANQAAILEILTARQAPQAQPLLAAAREKAPAEVRFTALTILGEMPPQEVVEQTLASASPWAREQAGSVYAGLAQARLAAGENEPARVMFETLAASGVSGAPKTAALNGLAQIASAASLDCIDKTVIALRAMPRQEVGADLATAAGNAAVAVYGAQPADVAKQRLVSVLDGPAPAEVKTLASKKLAELGVDAGALARREGWLTDWRVIGPFPNEGNSAFGKSFFDEAGALPEKLDLDGKAFEWKAVSGGEVPARIDLCAQFEPNQNTAAYAYAEFSVAEATSGLLLLGSDDGCEVWVNGAKAHAAGDPRSLVADQDRIPAEWVAGVNRVLVKVLQGGGDWQFCARVARQDGTPIDLSGLGGQ